MTVTARRIITFVLFGTAFTAQAQVPGTERLSWSGQLGIASGLVYRGIDLNHEVAVPSLDMAVEHASGLYAHGWLTRVDLPQPDIYSVDPDTNWQFLLDAGYNWRLSPVWSLNFAHSWYVYSDELADRTPHYREWSFSIDYGSLLVLNYAHTEDLWGLDERQDVISLDAHWAFSSRLIGAASFGRTEQSGVVEDRYHYLRLNLGYLLRDGWSVQLQFHDSFGVGDIYRDEGARGEWIAQIDWHW